MPLRLRPVLYKLTNSDKPTPGIACFHLAPFSDKEPPPFAIIPGYATTAADIVTTWRTYQIISPHNIVIGEEVQAIMGAPVAKETDVTEIMRKVHPTK